MLCSLIAFYWNQSWQLVLLFILSYNTVHSKNLAYFEEGLLGYTKNTVYVSPSTEWLKYSNNAYSGIHCTNTGFVKGRTGYMFGRFAYVYKNNEVTLLPIWQAGPNQAPDQCWVVASGLPSSHWPVHIPVSLWHTSAASQWHRHVHVLPNLQVAASPGTNQSAILEYSDLWNKCNTSCTYLLEQLAIAWLQCLSIYRVGSTKSNKMAILDSCI